MDTPTGAVMDKVLIVDDHDEIRRLLSITLRRSFELLMASSGAEAIEVVRRAQPKVVLLDVMMPGEPDGLGVLRVIKADPSLRRIAVGMLTARGQVADEEHARSLGADAYFRKPFSPSEVLAWVRDAVSRSSLRGPAPTC